jgi:hypothetical protein
MDSEITQPGRGELPPDFPRIAAIDIRRIRLDPPISFYSEGRRVTKNEAVELLVRTTVGFPVLAVTPVLFIGEVPVSSYRSLGNGLYRFLAYDPELLPPGARISVGWPDAPSSKVPTPFTFDPGAFPVV